MIAPSLAKHRLQPVIRIRFAIPGMPPFVPAEKKAPVRFLTGGIRFNPKNVTHCIPSLPAVVCIIFQAIVLFPDHPNHREPLEKPPSKAHNYRRKPPKG
jgi:hypothetical protein